jgi:acyl carrier protein
VSLRSFLLGEPQDYPVDPEQANEWARLHFPPACHAVASAVGIILVRQIGVSWKELSASTRFMDDLNAWEDFDGGQIGELVEKRFGLVISEKDRKGLNSISDLVNYIYVRGRNPAG